MDFGEPEISAIHFFSKNINEKKKKTFKLLKNSKTDM